MEAWRYEIQHGPDGEADYAWVYDASGAMVCTAKTHFAMQIVESINRRALSTVGGEAGETECDPDGCKAHIDAFMDRALKAESELARLEAQPGVVKALEKLRQQHENGLRLAKSRTGRDKAAASLRVIAEIEAALAAPVSQPANPAQVTDAMAEKCVKVCPQCEGEGSYADGLDEAACTTECTRCGGNGWIVDTAAIGAGGQAVAVKPLEWSKGVVDRAIPLPGMKYVACSTSPEGAWAWWLEEAPETRAVFSSEQAAKAAAQADYEKRVLSTLAAPVSQPANPAQVTINGLQRAHIERQEEWCPDQKPDLSFRGNEMAGEVGEACNIIKKLERERQGWRGSRATKEQLAEELADVVHTAVLCAITAGIDLEPAVFDKFNATSEKNGLASRLIAALGAGGHPVISPQPAEGGPSDAEVERQRAVGNGMAIAAGIIMSCWDNTVAAGEILSAAGYHSVKDMKADGIDDYDINLCKPALCPRPLAAENKGGQANG